MTAASKVQIDLQTILDAAEINGTLLQLPKVAIYFNELELRAIVRGFGVLHQIANGTVSGSKAQILARDAVS